MVSYGKQDFWDRIDSKRCPICGKEYQMRTWMIRHIELEHDKPFSVAKQLTDSTGIYVPTMYRRRK